LKVYAQRGALCASERSAIGCRSPRRSFGMGGDCRLDFRTTATMCCGIGAAPAADAGGPLEPFGDRGCSIGLCCARTQSAIGHDPKHGGSRDTVFESWATEYDADRALARQHHSRRQPRRQKNWRHLRGLLKKQNSAELQELDLGEVVRDSLEIVAPEAAR